MLRLILRRALYHGQTLGLNEPFMFKMAGHVVQMMKDAYPELVETEHHVAKAIKIEEEQYAHTTRWVWTTGQAENCRDLSAEDGRGFAFRRKSTSTAIHRLPTIKSFPAVTRIERVGLLISTARTRTVGVDPWRRTFQAPRHIRASA